MRLLDDVVPALGRAFFGSVAGGARELDDAHRAIRQGVPTSRRIAFTALRGGTGCSATAAAVATVLARRRSGRVLGVDGAAGVRSFAAHAGADRTGPTPRSRRRDAARTSWDATDGLAVTPSGLRVLRIGDPRLPSRQAAPAEWTDAVDPIARFFDVVVGDWGSRSPFVDLGAVAADAHVVALVTGADRSAIEEGVAHADAVRRHAPGTRVLVVPVDTTGAGLRAARTAAEWPDHAVHPIPSDPSVSRGGDRPTASRIALIQLTAALVDAAVDRRGDRAADRTTPEATR
jgi:MinD-like ATPase involved in chromosome partitioning or flagellar assembly